MAQDAFHGVCSHIPRLRHALVFMRALSIFYYQAEIFYDQAGSLVSVHTLLSESRAG
jgi:hypothetical protein